MRLMLRMLRRVWTFVKAVLDLGIVRRPVRARGRAIVDKPMGQRGVVHAINISNGGVPKLPRPACFITVDGLEGDRQRDLRYHGGPERAVCLYSLDLIEALRAEGHDIAPGSIGENLTLKGVDWSAMTPGATVTVGTVL